LIDVELAEHVIGAGAEMVSEVAPPQHTAGFDVDADPGSDHREVVEIESFILDDEFSMARDRGIVDRVDIVEVVVDGHYDVRPMSRFGIQDDFVLGPYPRWMGRRGRTR
jgi:hypothetical protein